MIHQNDNTTQDFDGKKFFTKARRVHVEEPLKALGFKKYKSSVIGRLTAGNVFQFFDFQKAAYGGHDFTVNVAIRPLFCPNHDYLTLLPGNRLSLMATKSKADKWWNCSTEAEGEKSFTDLFEMIEKYGIPFFDSTMTSRDIILSYQRNIFGINKFGARVAWGTVGWESFDLGHIFLHAGSFKQASQHFNASYKEFKKDDRDWAQKAAHKCLEIKGIVAAGQSQIDEYVSGTIQASKEKLKLVDW